MSRAIDHIGGKPIDAAWICERYDQVRNWLPPASFPEHTTKAGSLIDLIDEFDVFVLDAYGVLNVGAAPVPTAPDAVRELRSHGKTVLVLTNGATATSAQAWHRYLSYGLELDLEHVISSRDVMVAHMHELNLHFGVAAPAHVDLANLPGPTVLLTDASAYADVEVFLLLSSGAWSNAHQDQLCDALTLKPRPIWVANPDMAAPCDGGFTLEPGHFALGAYEASGIKPEYFGKPFNNAYAAVTARLQRLANSQTTCAVSRWWATAYTRISGVGLRPAGGLCWSATTACCAARTQICSVTVLRSARTFPSPPPDRPTGS